MSRLDYETGRLIERLKHEEDLPFHGIVQGLMRLADTRNLLMLRMCWPEVWADLWARYDSPGGRLPDDPPWPGDEPSGADS